MPTSRSYRDSCGVARALDVVGERWALLVVRELLLTPQRFSELRHALPGVSSNLLADRLRELEQHGVVHRPDGGRYDLTDRGRRLEPIVVALGDWGIDAPHPAEPASLSATSVLLFLRGHARPDPAAPPATCRLDLDGRAWTVRLHEGRIEIEPGEPPTADAALRTDPGTLSSLLQDPSTLAAACARGTAAIVGDRAAIDRLLHAVTDNTA
ncbi:winged helix-turn-helix transcriptional regulator [Dactylosporangium sp. CS-033363]|uniref:winged helix-turn-helix transcriptional regulator n=1 Tax=Dactylosporangium sp. CS-033363 TaxID=3239935 RepID=UPI003D8A42E1